MLGEHVVKGLALGGGGSADLARADAPDYVRGEDAGFEEAAGEGQFWTSGKGGERGGKGLPYYVQDSACYVEGILGDWYRNVLVREVGAGKVVVKQIPRAISEKNAPPQSIERNTQLKPMTRPCRFQISR